MSRANHYTFNPLHSKTHIHTHVYLYMYIYLRIYSALLKHSPPITPEMSSNIAIFVNVCLPVSLYPVLSFFSHRPFLPR